MLFLLHHLSNLLVPGDSVTHDVSELLLVLVVVFASHTPRSLILILTLIASNVTSGQKRLSSALKVIKITHFRGLRSIGS